MAFDSLPKTTEGVTNSKAMSKEQLSNSCFNILLPRQNMTLPEESVNWTVRHNTVWILKGSEQFRKNHQIPSGCENKIVECLYAYLTRNPRAKFPCYSVHREVWSIEVKGLMKPTLEEKIDWLLGRISEQSVNQQNCDPSTVISMHCQLLYT